MNRYGINFKSKDSVTVYYEKEIEDLLELISKHDFVSLGIVGKQTWLCGDDGDTQFKSVAFRCSEIESIHYFEIDETINN